MDIFLLLKDFQLPQRVFLTTEMLNWLIQTTRKYQNLMGLLFFLNPNQWLHRHIWENYPTESSLNVTLFLFSLWIYALSCFPCGRQHTLCCFGWLCISFCIWADDALLGFFVFLWVATPIIWVFLICPLCLLARTVYVDVFYLFLIYWIVLGFFCFVFLIHNK